MTRAREAGEGAGGAADADCGCRCCVGCDCVVAPAACSDRRVEAADLPVCFSAHGSSGGRRRLRLDSGVDGMQRLPCAETTAGCAAARHAPQLRSNKGSSGSQTRSGEHGSGGCSAALQQGSRLPTVDEQQEAVAKCSRRRIVTVRSRAAGSGQQLESQSTRKV